MLPRFTKTWQFEWKERVILVEDWWDILLRTCERMLIDGEPVAEHTGWLGVRSDLEGVIIDGRELRMVRASLASVDFGLRAGCTIYVDDVAIGGDTDKQFLT